jgi:hypothetical protein
VEGDCLVPGSPGGLQSPSLAGGHGNKRSGLCCRCLRWAHDDTAASPPYTARLDAVGQEALECVCIHAWQGVEGMENAGTQDQPKELGV